MRRKKKNKLLWTLNIILDIIIVGILIFLIMQGAELAGGSRLFGFGWNIF